MAGTSADKLALLQATKDDLKAALTEKGQAPGDVFAEYPGMVRAIETGTELPELTSPGAAADLRQGKQLIDQEGNVVDGGLADAEQATPGISVDSAGLITASAQQAAGYVAAGTKSATKQLETSNGYSFTPSVGEQSLNVTGKYMLGPVIVEGDANLIPENIKSGVSIFGVLGTLDSCKCINFSDSDVSVGLDSQGNSQIKLSDSSITASSQIFAIDFGAQIESRSEATYMARCSSSLHVDYNASVTHRFYCEFSGKEGSVVPIVEDGALVLHFVDFGGFYNSLDDAGLLDAADWNHFDCRFVFTN